MPSTPHRPQGYRARLSRALPCVGLLALLCFAPSCAYEVIWLGDEPASFVAPDPPLFWTPAVKVQSFEAKYVTEAGFVERFARELRGANLFVSVLYPIPAEVDPEWEMRLLVKETFVDPASNLWKAVLNGVFPPARFVVYAEEEYTLDVEALLTRRDELIGTYKARGPVRYRYQSYAPEQEREAQALDLILARTSAEICRQIADDAQRLVAEDAARIGRR
jgi:hypothetical protein